jgi:hypothetical protein
MKKQHYSVLFFLFTFITSQSIYAQLLWQQSAPNFVGLAADENEGSALSFSANGKTFATTAANNGSTANLQGRVRVYTKSGANWVQKGNSLIGAAAGDNFGRSVALDSTGNTIAIGAPNNDAGFGNFSSAGHVRVFSWLSDSGVWVQKGSTLLADSLGDNFGYSVSISYDGNTVAIGSPFRQNRGRVKVFHWDSVEWVQLGNHVNGTNLFDLFGSAVSLDRTGSILAVGAPGNDAGGLEAGQVKIFELVDTTWIQRGSNINGSVSDYSGTSLNLSADGKRMAIGAPQDFILGGFGGAKVYAWNNTAWIQLGASLISPNFFDFYGETVSLSGDGNKLAVGARGIVAGNENGLVEVYEWSGIAWQIIGDTLKGDSASDEFGKSVALSYDGNALLVGAPRAKISPSISGLTRLYEYKDIPCIPSSSNITLSICSTSYISPSGNYTYTTSGTYLDTIPNAINCDSVITINLTLFAINKTVAVNGNVFTATDSTATYQWLDCANNKQAIAGATNRSQVALGCVGNTLNYAVQLTKNGCVDTSACQLITVNRGQLGLDIDGEAQSDLSGGSVSLSANGDIVAIGAIGNDENGDAAGHVRVYAWNGTVWVQRGNDIDGEAAVDLSGCSVSLSANGEIVAIGAIGNDGNGNNSGHVRVYVWGDTAWVQRGNDIDGEAARDESGYSVSLSANGNVLAIGATSNDGNGDLSGHVRVYVWNGTAWVQRGKDIDGEAATDLSGNSVSLSANGDIVAIGASGNDGNGDRSGHVRVYVWSGTAWVQRGKDIDGEAAGDNSGDKSVSLSANGNMLAIGAAANAGNGNISGHVRVYAWNDTAWVQWGNDIDGEAANDQSGCSVSLSANGEIVAIGAIGNDGNGNNSGHVRVYVWGDTAWVQRGNDIDGEAAGDNFGGSLSISANGEVLAIGAIYNDGNGNNSGQVRVFKECTFPITVSVEEESIVSSTAKNSHFTLYPNPTTGLFRIKANTNEAVQSVMVYNSVGELVMQQTVTDDEMELDLQNQPAGIYFVRMATENGYVSQRLLLQK